MKAAITRIGSFKGVPAFEYEIRDEAGTLVAADYVVIHPSDSESWDDLAAVAEEFLRRRAFQSEIGEAKEQGVIRLPGLQAPALKGEAPDIARHMREVEVTRSQAEVIKSARDAQVKVPGKATAPDRTSREAGRRAD